MMGRRRQRAFTLIEVVIALTLVSLVMLGLLSALRTFARSSDVVDGASSRIEEMALVSRFLGATVSRLAKGRVGDSSAARPYFVGGERTLAWLGILPARFGGGGLHLFSLALEEGSGGASLTLRFLPYSPGIDPGRLAGIEPQFRLDGVGGFEVSYESRDGAWAPQWNESARVPERIAFVLDVGGMRWPDIVVQPRELDSGAAGGGEIVIGGSGG